MRRFLAIWAVVAAAALAARIGGYPLLEPDEGRNAEVGREMAETNDYVLPHLDGLPYLDKPVVYFAAEAAAMEIGGATETAARLPAWLFTVLTACVIAWFAARTGIDPALSAVAFLAMPLTMAFARTVIFDSALSLFITVAICAFYVAIEDGRKSAAAIAWAAIAFGVLTKGPVAIALPLLVALPHAIWRRRARALWSWLGLFLFIAVIAPWVWAVSLAIPDFLHYVVVTETAQRLATKALKRTGPPWYFIPYLIGGAFPWAIAAFFGDRRRAEGDRFRDRYLLLWILVPFVFFSISQSKRPQYILPLMPPIALFVASRWNDRMTRVAAWAAGTIGVVLLIASTRLRLRPEYADSARDAAIAMGVCSLVAAAVAFFVKRRDIAIAALSLPILIIPLATNPLMQSLALRRSAKNLASAIRPHLTPSTEVVGLEAFSGSLAFYLERPIVVVSPDGEEFTSNYIIRHYAQFADASNLRSTSTLQRVFDRSRPRIVIVGDNDAKNRAIVEANNGRRIAEGGRYVAYTIAR